MIKVKMTFEIEFEHPTDEQLSQWSMTRDDVCDDLHTLHSAGVAIADWLPDMGDEVMAGSDILLNLVRAKVLLVETLTQCN